MNDAILKLPESEKRVEQEIVQADKSKPDKGKDWAQ
jgi:hypothetical protein